LYFIFPNAIHQQRTKLKILWWRKTLLSIQYIFLLGMQSHSNKKELGPFHIKYVFQKLSFYWKSYQKLKPWFLDFRFLVKGKSEQRNFGWIYAFLCGIWRWPLTRAYFWPAVNKRLTRVLFDLTRWYFFWPKGQKNWNFLDF